LKQDVGSKLVFGRQNHGIPMTPMHQSQLDFDSASQTTSSMDLLDADDRNDDPFN